MSIPLDLAKYLIRFVEIALTGQRFYIVDAEVVPAAICSIRELGDRVAKVLRRGADIAVAQCRHAANGGGERLGDARHVGALLVGLLGKRKGLREKATEKQSLSVIDGQDDRCVGGIQRGRGQRGGRLGNLRGLQWASEVTQSDGAGPRQNHRRKWGELGRVDGLTNFQGFSGVCLDGQLEGSESQKPARFGTGTGRDG